MTQTELAFADWGAILRSVPAARIKQADTMSPGLRSNISGASAGLERCSDSELIALAGEGQTDAFEIIYQRHAAAAYALAYRVCGGASIAEDAVQEAFVSLWRNRRRYEPGRGEVRSWLLGMVHNCGIDRLRRMAVQERRRASAEGIEERLEEPDRTDAVVEQRAQAGEVRAALATLPAEQRQVVELAYYGGMSQREIASILGLPVGTIKGRTRLAMAKLQTRLETASESLTPSREVEL